MAYQQRESYGRQYSGSGGGSSSESRVPSEGPWIAFVGNLPLQLVQSDVEQIFKEQRVKSVRMLRDRESDEFRGTAFVEFLDRKSLVDALDLNGALLGANTVRVDVADDKKKRGGPGGGPAGQNDRHDAGGRPNYSRPGGPPRGGGRGGYGRSDSNYSNNDYPDSRDYNSRGGGGGRGSYGDGGRGGGGGYRDNRQGSGYNQGGGGGGGGGYQQRGGYGGSRGGDRGGDRYGSGGRDGGGYSRGGGGGYNDRRGGGGGGSYNDSYSSRRDDRGEQEFNDIKPADPESAANRPKLNLQPRSVDAPVGQLADTLARSSIFGGGKPREAKPGDEIPAASTGDTAGPHPTGLARSTSKQSNPDAAV